MAVTVKTTILNVNRSKRKQLLYCKERPPKRGAFLFCAINNKQFVKQEFYLVSIEYYSLLS